MQLDEQTILSSNATDKDLWLSDGNGLRLLVKRSGAKYWRFKYRFDRKQKTLALGVFPEVSLAAARKAAAGARVDLDRNIDPAVYKREQKEKVAGIVRNSFESIALAWWKTMKPRWSEGHANRIFSRLKQDVFPRIGGLEISSIERGELVATIEAVERRGAVDVAKRVQIDLRRIFSYAFNRDIIKIHPAVDLEGVVIGVKPQHRPSLRRDELPDFLRALDSYETKGRLLTKLAVQLLVLTFVRPGELRGARWNEFDLDQALWRIPGERMKMGSDHIVPLSRQSLAVIEQIKPITQSFEHLFPSERNITDCMSDNTMRKAIFKLGYDGKTQGKSKAVPHGFRATASSILNEAGFNPDAIERQLSHIERNGVRAAYIHHARYLEERTEMMQWYADTLDELRTSTTTRAILSRG